MLHIFVFEGIRSKSSRLSLNIFTGKLTSCLLHTPTHKQTHKHTQTKILKFMCESVLDRRDSPKKRPLIEFLEEHFNLNSRRS